MKWINRSAGAAIALAALVAGGCGWFGNSTPEYFEAEPPVQLQVPADLDRPATGTALLMPGEPMPMPATEELEPRPPRVIAATGGAVGEGSQIGWSSEGPYLQVADSPAGVARRLRFAIERAGMNLVEQDPSGAHRFDYYHVTSDEEGFFESLLFWRDDADNYSGSYRVRLVPEGDETRVYLRNADGSTINPDAAEHMLARFGERLG